MSSHPPLAEIVDAHIAKATPLAKHVRRQPIEHAPEHLDANGNPLHAQDRVGVTLGRIASEDAARGDLAALEARAHELDAAREQINAEQNTNAELIRAWHRTNGHSGTAMTDAHLFQHHGDHTYLGLDNPDEMLRARDEQIAKLQAALGVAEEHRPDHPTESTEETS